MLRSPALFGRLLRALRSNRTAVHVLPSIRVSFSTVSRINTSGFCSFKTRIGRFQHMSSKILYRRILSSQELSPTLSHPHKAPSTPTHPPNSLPSSSHPPSASDEVTSTSDDKPTKEDPLKQQAPVVNTTSENISKAKACPLEVGSDMVSTTCKDPEDQELTSSEDVGVSAKVSLGEVTEIRGVIFDMDGTLTLPVLRFAEMKEKLGLRPTDDILPTVQKLPPEERAKAFEIIEEFEREGVENMKLQPGVLDLFQFLGERDIKRALMTRNAWVPTNAFLKRLREELEASKDKYPSLNSEELFSMVITREFEPCKPHPASVFEICKSWDLKPEEVVVVGDDKTDMTCGLRAGVGVNILLRNERNVKQPDYSHFTVNKLTEIITLMSSLMTVPFKQEP